MSKSTDVPFFRKTAQTEDPFGSTSMTRGSFANSTHFICARDTRYKRVTPKQNMLKRSTFATLPNDMDFTFKEPSPMKKKLLQKTTSAHIFKHTQNTRMEFYE